MKKHRLIFTKSYTRRAARSARRHPELLGQYEKTLALLEADPFHPALRLHKLKGRLADLHAVSVNITHRISLILIVAETTIIPVDIGTHDGMHR